MKFLTSAPRAAGAGLALALAMLCTADWASAQPTDAQLGAIKANCRSDFMSNCWGVPRGGTEAFQCLKDHLASLSAPCQQAVKAVIATATPPSGSGTAATAAKPATETKPAAAAAEPATSPSPAGTDNAVKSTPEGSASSAAATPTSSGTADAATSTGQGAPQSNAKAAQGSSPAPAALEANAAKKKAFTASLNAAAQTSGAAASGAEAAGASKSKPAATQATAPVASAETAAGSPQALGFIPPRKKIMLARFCRDDFNAHCPGVDLGGGRAISCLEANKASLTPDCRDVLTKLIR